MPKFNVYAVFTASKHLGEFEAPDKNAAADLAAQSEECRASLCHQCARDLDLNDPNYPSEFVVEEAD